MGDGGSGFARYKGNSRFLVVPMKRTSGLARNDSVRQVWPREFSGVDHWANLALAAADGRGSGKD